MHAKYKNHNLFAQHNDDLKANTSTRTRTKEKMQLQKKNDCPLVLQGKGLQTNVIYQLQAAVETNTSTETYVGLATSFK